MGLTIVKTDARGAYRMIAKEDLYLNEDQTKVIVVKRGEEVPKEAAFVLAGRGGTIPVRYAEMLNAFVEDLFSQFKSRFFSTEQRLCRRRQLGKDIVIKVTDVLHRFRSVASPVLPQSDG